VTRAPQRRRAAEVVAAVAIWIAAGLVFHLSANAYLLLGVPLTVAFQCGVRRQPLHTLWVRDAPAFRLDAAGWVMTMMLAAFPAYRLARSLDSGAPAVETLWYVAAVAGAFPAAFALRNWHPQTTRALWACLATAGVIGTGMMLLNIFGAGVSHATFRARMAEFVTTMLLYVPVVFVLEEVSFRGAFDAHMHHQGEPGEYSTAFLVSALWGLWHLPIALGAKPLPVLLAGLVGVHCAVGVPLSLYWRRSGNLLVSGSTHALVDAVRNALFFAGRV